MQVTDSERCKFYNRKLQKAIAFGENQNNFGLINSLNFPIRVKQCHKFDESVKKI